MINSHFPAGDGAGKTPYNLCLSAPVRDKAESRGSPSGGSRVTLDTL